MTITIDYIKHGEHLRTLSEQAYKAKNGLSSLNLLDKHLAWQLGRIEEAYSNYCNTMANWIATKLPARFLEVLPNLAYRGHYFPSVLLTKDNKISIDYSSIGHWASLRIAYDIVEDKVYIRKLFGFNISANEDKHPDAILYGGELKALAEAMPVTEI